MDLGVAAAALVVGCAPALDAEAAASAAPRCLFENEAQAWGSAPGEAPMDRPEAAVAPVTITQADFGAAVTLTSQSISPSAGLAERPGAPPFGPNGRAEQPSWGLRFSTLRRERPFGRGGAQYTSILENDSYGQGSDKHYTNGVRFDRLSAPRVLAYGPFADQAEETLRFGIGVGQEIYTPHRKRRTTLTEQDRPYAGWLYLSGRVVRATPRVEDSLELSLGVVGPSSMARQTQTAYHQATGTPAPAGWHTQLKDEPGLELTLQRQYRLTGPTLAGIETEAVALTSATIGNVRTNAAAGLSLRFGVDLDRDFGPARMAGGWGSFGGFRAERGASAYLFAGVLGRAVGRDIFLDGNTFRDSRRVEKKTFVPDVQMGGAFLYDGMRVALTFVQRGESFEHQPLGKDRFASLSVTFTR